MNQRQRQRKLVPIYMVLVVVVIIVLIIALASGGGEVSIPGIGTPEVALFPHGIEGNPSPAQQAAFDRLARNSIEPPFVRIEEGAVRFMTMAVPILTNKSVTPEERAREFIQEYADLLDIDNPSQNLIVDTVATQMTSLDQVVFSQTIHQIPVYASRIRVHLDIKNSSVIGINGSYIPGQVPPLVPSIQPNQAQVLVSQSLGVTDASFSTTPRLYYWSPALDGSGPSQPQLVWEVTLVSEQAGGEWQALVDAQQGKIISVMSSIINVSDREVYDNHNNSYLNTDSSTRLMNNEGCIRGQICLDDEINAFNFSGDYSRLLEQELSRTTFDGRSPSTIRSYTHVTFNICNSPSPNAVWNNGSIYYSDGFSEANDVVAHELTHGVIDSLGGLVYSNESGALNESFADVFGVLLDNGVANNDWNDANWRIEDWDIGELLPGGRMRNLENPSSIDRGHRPRDPDHNDYYWHLNPSEIPNPCQNDSGHVHSNSGIPNKAAYLLLQNERKEFHNIQIRGIGPHKGARIYFNALSEYLFATWSFRDARDAILASCLDLIGQHQITNSDCQQVNNAFAAVGIGPLATTLPAPTPTPLPIPILNTSTILVFDTSGSMNEPDTTGRTKLQAAQAAGSSILEVIEAEFQAQTIETTQVGIVDFNFDTRLDAGLSNDIRAAQIALRRFLANGGTGMPDGLKVALDSFPASSNDTQRIVILLSDGMANVGHGGDSFIDRETVRQQVIAQAERAKEIGVCIYTVGFGVPGAIGTVSGEDSIDEELLRQVASITECGTYYNAQNANELANVYVELRHVSTGNILLRNSGPIAQSQTVDIGTVQVPPDQLQMLFTLNWPGSRLEPLILDPNNQSVDSNYPGASFATYSSLASVIIQNPLPGQWQLSARGADVPEGQTIYNAILSARPAPATSIPTSAPTATPTPQPLVSPGLPVAIVLLLVGGGAIFLYVLAQTGRRSRALPPPSGTAPGGLKLVGLAGEVSGRSFPIGDGMVIGRGAACQIRLSDRAVSRQHASLRYAQGQWFIQDLGSSTGTLVNGRTETATALRNGDRIRIGSSEFEFRG